MEKIYFKQAYKATNLDDLLLLLFSNNVYAVKTYHDEFFKHIQCRAGSRRSFEDLLSIAKTYYPETTEEELMQSLINIRINFYYCHDISKIVFLGSHGTILTKFVNFNDYNGKVREDSYTQEQLNKILKNIQ